jgi:hypothetical protein
MKLEQAQELYTDYMEGTLSPAMRLALEQYFDRDAEASEDYKAFSSIMQSFQTVKITDLEPPHGFRASVLERVTAESSAVRQTKPISFADTIRGWFGGSQLVRLSSVGVATLVVGAVVFASFHGHNNGNSQNSDLGNPFAGPTTETSTVLGVATKSGDDGNQYHLFRVHLPSSTPEAYVSAEVLSDPSQITDQAIREQQARPALKQPVDLTNDEELQIPVALLQSVPDSTTITLLVQWTPVDSQQSSGEQVVFTPANLNAQPPAFPVAPDSQLSYYNALQYISSAYHITLVSDTNVTSDVMVNSWSASTLPIDALNALVAAGFKVHELGPQTYQIYK